MQTALPTCPELSSTYVVRLACAPQLPTSLSSLTSHHHPTHTTPAVSSHTLAVRRRRRGENLRQDTALCWIPGRPNPIILPQRNIPPHTRVESCVFLPQPRCVGHGTLYRSLAMSACAVAVARESVERVCGAWSVSVSAATTYLEDTLFFSTTAASSRS